MRVSGEFFCGAAVFLIANAAVAEGVHPARLGRQALEDRRRGGSALQRDYQQQSQRGEFPDEAEHATILGQRYGLSNADCGVCPPFRFREGICLRTGFVLASITFCDEVAALLRGAARYPGAWCVCGRRSRSNEEDRMDVTLLWIVGAALVGGALSLLLAGLLAFTVFSAWIPRMVSYAVGALLGAAFLDVLPEAMEKSSNVEVVSAVTLFGVLGFFLLEKAALWRHQHEHGDAHPHAHIAARTGMMILVGDAFHNFVDGVTIAAAFLTDAKLGIATMVAVAAHEIPQELGDFVVLLNSGYTRSRALLLNLLSSLASVAGGVVGYLVLADAQAVIPYILAVAAASFIYIAVADLIPHLHRVTDARSTAWQIVLVAAGVATIVVADVLLH